MSDRRIRAALVVAGAAVVLAFAVLTSAGQATHSPANKAWATASRVETMHTQLTPGSSEEQHVVLMETRAKYSNPTDLRLSVTSECALWTNTATTGDDDAETKARVEQWITIDGKTVPVTGQADDPSTPTQNEAEEEPPPASIPGTLTGPTDPDVQGAPGHVVFCNRANRMKTEGFDDTGESDNVIRSYNRSRTANAFNWGALDIGRNYDDQVVGEENGKGTLLIELHARLATEIINPKTDGTSANSPAAMAAVGKRTLFIEPVKMANDAAF